MSLKGEGPVKYLKFIKHQLSAKILKWPIEKRLFFLLSQTHCLCFHALEIEILRQLINSEDVNRSKVIEIVLRNGVAGFAYQHLKSNDILSGQGKKEFQSIYRQTTLRNLRLLNATSQVLQLLSINKISVIPLKGAVASNLIFQDLGLYPSSDIDILVCYEQLVASKEILCQHGYEIDQKWSEEELSSCHYHLMFRKNGILIEVHWNLVKRYFSIEPDFWWQEHIIAEWHNQNITLLAPEKYIQYLVFRLFDHCFFPLRFWALLHAVIEKYNDQISWNNLLAEAKRNKMWRLISFALCFVTDWYGTEIPTKITKNPILGYKLFERMVLSGIFSGIQRKHLRMLGYTFLLDSLGAIANVLFSRLFSPLGELRLRYNLPQDSMRIYLYYLLNPFLLIFRKEDSKNNKTKENN